MDLVTKFNYLVTENVLKTMNATRRLIIQSDWGYKNSTKGHYDGFVGDLQRGIADIGGKNY